MEKTERHVNIGQIQVGTPGIILRATLGSCVGVALVWKRQKICALAHCLMCQAPKDCTRKGASYVSIAIPTLLEELEVPNKSRRELVAYIAGGGQMLGAQHLTGGRPQGERNIDVALSTLKDHRIYLQHHFPPSNSGTQIFVDCETFEVTARFIDVKHSEMSVVG